MALGFFKGLTAACLIASAVVGIASGAGTLPTSVEQADTQDAVILMYHRFGDSRWPSTNIRTEQLEAHLDYLVENDFNVLPLGDVIAAFRDGTPLPPRTIVITVDDAYSSFLEEGWPRIKARGFPVTLFVSTEPVDRKLGGYLTWDQIRALEADGVAIGHHGHTHNSFFDLRVDASVADIEQASARFEAELGHVPDLLAYPYGEYDAAVAKKLEEMGFKAALGQYSGVAAAHGKPFELPRFALNENYSDMNRFRLLAGSRALPVTDMVPADPRVSDNPPAFGFSVESHVRGLGAMSCFPSHLSEAAEITRLGDHRVEVRFDEPFPAGRSRMNCTMPGPEGRWYWFGRPFFVER